jgi:hypothetical protein
MVVTITAAPGHPDPPPSPATVSPRPNPFLLPASTTSQFLLLVSFLAVSAAATADFVVGAPQAWFGRYRTCAIEAVEAASPTFTRRQLTHLYVECMEGVDTLRGLVGLAGGGVSLLLVAAGLLAHRRAVARRTAWQPYDPADFPGTAGDVARCLDEVESRRRPTLHVDVLRAHRGGRVVGTNRRPHVKLGIGLLRGDEPANRAALRAVLRHELAHIRNRDLVLSALVVVVPAVYLAVVALPLLLTTALAYDTDAVWPAGWRLAALLVVLLLVRASVFRAREHYADVRAASVSRGGQDSAFLRDAFDAHPTRLPGSGSTRGLGTRVGALLTPFRVHPDPRRREAVVARPDALLRPSTVEALATGVVAGVAFPYLRLVAALLVQEASLAALFAGTGVGALVATVVGTSMWRAAQAALVRGEGPPWGVRPALALAAGLLLGDVLAPLSVTTWPSLVLGRPGAALVGAAVLALGLVVLLRWIAVSATVWLTVATTRPRVALSVGLGLAALNYGLVQVVWGHTTATLAGQPILSGLGFGLASASPFFVIAVLAAAFSLATVLIVRSGAVTRPRLALPSDDGTDAGPVHRPPVVRVLSSAAVALVPGVVYAVLDVTVLHGAVAAQWVGPATGRVLRAAETDAEALMVNIRLIVGIALVQLAVAVVVAVLARRAGAPTTFAHAAFAAPLAGLGAALGAFVYPFAVGCGPEIVACSPSVAAAGIGAFVMVGCAGGLLAAVVGWLVALSWAVATRRGRVPPDPEPVTAPRSRRLVRVRAAVFAAVVAVLIASTVPVLAVLLRATSIATADPVRAVAEAPVDTTSYDAATICRAFLAHAAVPSLQQGNTLEELRLARMGRHSEDVLLRAAGSVWEEEILTAVPMNDREGKQAYTAACPRTDL